MGADTQGNRSGSGAAMWFFAAICCVGICGMVCFVAYSNTNHTQPRRLWSPMIVGSTNGGTILGETRQLEFWTPSSKTKDYLHQEKGEVTPTEKWQIIGSEDPLLEFGSMLRSNQS